MIRIVVIITVFFVSLFCSAGPKAGTANLQSLPQGVTLTLGQSYFVVSVLDNDYLPYTKPVKPADIGSYDADGHKDVLLDYKGSIPAGGVLLYVPYKATASKVILPAYSQRTFIPGELTADGRAAALVLYYNEQELTGATGMIKVTIRPEAGEPIVIKQLDLNRGLGSDGLGVALAVFSLKANSSGKKGTIALRAIPGVPDSNFNDEEHRFIYAPIVSESGRLWLNNNLGANYAKVGHEKFNPVQQAQSPTDRDAYGSLYQWGRKSDGHELIHHDARAGISSGMYEGQGQVASDTLSQKAFLYGYEDWCAGCNDKRWQVGGTNNPCPQGYRLSDKEELAAEFRVYAIQNTASALASVHRFTLAGSRYSYTGHVIEQGIMGYYWTSTVRGLNPHARVILENAALSGDMDRTSGYSVRCIKE